MQYLKADIAATILIGPFVAIADGVTPETSITLAAADHAELMKHDGTAFVDLTSDSRAFTHKEGGWYTLVLGTGDTDTEGRLTVLIMDTDVCLPVWKDFMVVNANVYDSLFAVAATDYLQVDTLQLGGGTQSATDLKDFADAGYDPTTNKVQGVVLADTVTTLTGHTVQTGDSYTRLGTAGAGLTAVPWNSAWDAEVQSEVQDVLEANDLDHLIQVTAGSEEPTDGTYLDQIMHKASGQTYDATTDSLEALRDTLSSATITTVAAVSGDTITVVPYTTWEFTIDGLSDLSNALANGVFFTVKEKQTDADASAILQVQEGVGLLYINKVAGTAAKATLTIGAGEDEITVHVNASQTGLVEKRGLIWDIKQVITASEDADQMATGAFHIADEGVTRALTVT